MHRRSKDRDLLSLHIRWPPWLRENGSNRFGVIEASLKHLCGKASGKRFRELQVVDRITVSNWLNRICINRS